MSTTFRNFVGIEAFSNAGLKMFRVALSALAKRIKGGVRAFLKPNNFRRTLGVHFAILNASVSIASRGWASEKLIPEYKAPRFGFSM
jgi:hypothetical protein